MKEKDYINVYWSPAYSQGVENSEWNMLYPDPINLFTSLNKNKNIDIEPGDSYFSCPATKDFFKKTYVFNNAINCKYEYNFNYDPVFFQPITENYLGSTFFRKESINSHPMVSLSMSYIFFAEESLTATFSSPAFHKPEYTNYGVCIPGEFDIGQWFRPYAVEIQLWNKEGIFELKENEPFLYVKFNTDKKIKLHRFKYNKQLGKYAAHCINYKNIFGNFKPLSQRYAKFKESRLNDLILKEIKNNLIGENNV